MLSRHEPYSTIRYSWIPTFRVPRRAFSSPRSPAGRRETNGALRACGTIYHVPDTIVFGDAPHCVATDPEVGGAEQRSLDIGMVAPDPYGWVCERIERTRYDRLVVLSMLAVGRR